MDIAAGERQFIEEARHRILEHSRERRDAECFDKLHAVVRSTTGNVYEGMAFETSVPNFNVCAERHAISNLQYAETEATNLDAIFIAGPVPDEDAGVTTPCGACRHVIHQFSNNATVFCSNFVADETGWTMDTPIERYTAEELYPNHRNLPTWG